MSNELHLVMCDGISCQNISIFPFGNDILEREYVYDKKSTTRSLYGNGDILDGFR